MLSNEKYCLTPSHLDMKNWLFVYIEGIFRSSLGQDWRNFNRYNIDTLWQEIT